jgi:hypothetical protein
VIRFPIGTVRSLVDTMSRPGALDGFLQGLDLGAKHVSFFAQGLPAFVERSRKPLDFISGAPQFGGNAPMCGSHLLKLVRALLEFLDERVSIGSDLGEIVDSLIELGDTSITRGLLGAQAVDLVTNGAQRGSFLTERVLAFVERCSKLPDLIPGALFICGQTLVIGSDSVELAGSFLELEGERVSIGFGRRQLLISLIQLGDVLIAAGLLGAQAVDLVTKAAGLGAERFPFLRHRLNLVRSDHPQAVPKSVELGRDPLELGGDLVAFACEPVSIRFEQVVIDLKLLVVGREAIELISKLQVLEVGSIPVGFLGDRRQGRHRDYFRFAAASRWRRRRVDHFEGLIAPVATNVLANVDPADMQSCLTARAKNGDPLDRLIVAHGTGSLVQHGRPSSSPQSPY